MNQDKSILNTKEAENRGIQTSHCRMANGEYRFRLIGSDGSCYVRTEAGSQGEWQKSHMHRQTCELYIVQKGWIAIAQEIEGNLDIHIYHCFEYFIINVNIPHNAYLSADTVLHTVKFGICPAGDWISCSQLDAKTKLLTEDDIKSFVNK